MAIYSKRYAKKLVNDSIRIDEDCYFADKVTKIRAVVEGETKSRVFYVTELLADNGTTEIHDVITAKSKRTTTQLECSTSEPEGTRSHK